MKANVSILQERLQDFAYALRLTTKFYPQKLLCKALLTILTAVTGFFSLQYMLQYVINGAASGASLGTLLSFMLLMLAANIVLKCIEAVYSALIDPIITRRSATRFEKSLMDKLLKMDLADYEDPHAYDLTLSALSMGKEAIGGVMDFVGEMLSAVVQLALSVWLIVQIDPWLLLFPIIPLLLNPLNLRIDQIYIEMMHKEQSVNRKKEYVRRTFYQKEYACDMRLTHMPRVMLREFQSTVDRCKALRVSYGRKLATLFFILSFLTNATTLLAIIYSVYHTLVTHTMMIGDCLVVLNLFGEVANNIQNMARMFSWMDETALNVKEYRAFMQKQPAIVAPEHPWDIQELTSISAKNACFAYTGSQDPAINALTLHINKGEKIALVGENGAGKTTLIKLLLRLYDVQSGSINANGRNIKGYDPPVYRKRFAVVLQEHPLVAVSIAENVLGRRCTHNDEPRVRSALEAVGMWETVSRLPRGMYTPVTREFSAEGANLSVGQQQLLSIASIYAQDCDVVILDEPSSALDPLAERDMYNTMLAACKGRTVIFITHRLSSVQDADRICLCGHGTILEEGTHTQLMARNGQYARMFNAQAAAYKL